MKNFLSLVNREFRLFFANKIMLILYIGGPVLYGVLFGYVYSKGKLTDLPIVVLDKDNSPSSARLIDMLDESDVLKVKEVKREGVDMQKLFMNEDAYAVVSIPDNFEGDMMQSRHPEINTYINNANLLPSGFVTRAIMASVTTLNVMKTMSVGKKPEAFRLNTFRLFNPSGNYFLSVWPSYLGIILEAVVMVVLGLSFASEQEAGTFRALYRQSNNSVLLLMLGKLVPYLLLSLLLLGVYGVYFYLFRQPYPKNISPLLLINMIFIMANCFIGMAAGVLFKSQLKCLQFLMIFSIPIYITSGFSWPYDQNGWAAQLFSILFPFMPFVNGMRVLLIEQGTLSDIREYLNLQLIQLLIYFTLAYFAIRLNLRRAASPSLT